MIRAKIMNSCLNLSKLRPKCCRSFFRTTARNRRASLLALTSLVRFLWASPSTHRYRPLWRASDWRCLPADTWRHRRGFPAQPCTAVWTHSTHRHTHPHYDQVVTVSNNISTTRRSRQATCFCCSFSMIEVYALFLTCVVHCDAVNWNKNSS